VADLALRPRTSRARTLNEGIRLATSRYQATDLICASGLVPVAISVGLPKWPLGYRDPDTEGSLYELTVLRELAPYGLLQIEDDDEFTDKYVGRLDGFGVEHIQRRIGEISDGHDGRGLVFLCFEPAGEFCHRNLFARWLEEQTGGHVPELERDEPGLF
jgi:hypothetical protein